jgi:hypothetical protein
LSAEQTQQETLTILIEGLFTQMAKKAFKRLRIATPLRCLRAGFSGRDVASELREINLLLLLCAGFDARLQRPTRKSVASRWLAVVLAIDRVGFTVQRFRRMM